MIQKNSDYYNWQFLRRNLDYQKDYDQGDVDPYVWGLKKFCDYRVSDLPEDFEVVSNSIEIFGTHTKDELLNNSKIFLDCSFFSIKNFLHKLTRKKKYLVMVIDLEKYKTAGGNPEQIIQSQIKKQINEDGELKSPTKINKKTIQPTRDDQQIERIIKVYDEMEKGKTAYQIIRDHIGWFYDKMDQEEYSIETYTSLPANDYKRAKQFIRLAPFIKFNFK